MIQSRTQEIERITGAVQEAKNRIESMEGSLLEFRSETEAEEKRLEAELEEMNAKLAEAQDRRQAFREKIETELLRTYERIRKRSGGLGLVAAHRRHCIACEMQVPHQLYVVLRRGEELVNCDGCGRLMYWSGHFPKERDRLESRAAAAIERRKKGSAKPAAS